MSIQEYMLRCSRLFFARRIHSCTLTAGGLTMTRLFPLAIVTSIALGVGVAAQTANDWPTVGNDPGGMKYSPLTQITPANVGRLAKAWTYDTGAPANGYTITPIVISNVMYLPIQGTTI